MCSHAVIVTFNQNSLQPITSTVIAATLGYVAFFDVEKGLPSLDFRGILVTFNLNSQALRRHLVQLVCFNRNFKLNFGGRSSERIKCFPSIPAAVVYWILISLVSRVALVAGWAQISEVDGIEWILAFREVMVKRVSRLVEFSVDWQDPAKRTGIPVIAVTAGNKGSIVLADR